MTEQEINTRLYEKMFAEQEQFKEQLLHLTPIEILDRAYEYCVREDILLVLEDSDRSKEQCEALLKSDTPLADVFLRFQKRETDYMDTVRDTLECYANELIRADFIQSQREAR